MGCGNLGPQSQTRSNISPWYNYLINISRAKRSTSCNVLRSDREYIWRYAINATHKSKGVTCITFILCFPVGNRRLRSQWKDKRFYQKEQLYFYFVEGNFPEIELNQHHLFSFCFHLYGFFELLPAMKLAINVRTIPVYVKFCCTE